MPPSRKRRSRRRAAGASRTRPAAVPRLAAADVAQAHPGRADDHQQQVEAGQREPAQQSADQRGPGPFEPADRRGGQQEHGRARVGGPVSGSGSRWTARSVHASGTAQATSQQGRGQDQGRVVGVDAGREAAEQDRGDGAGGQRRAGGARRRAW